MMGLIVTFHFMVMLPDLEKPLAHEERMATLEECIGTAATFLFEARRNEPQGVYQAGCTIEIPRRAHS